MRGLLLFVCLVVVISQCAANVTVYSSGFQNGFADYGWGTKNDADTTEHHSATCSYSFEPAAYDAAYFYKSASISTTTYSGLTFWVYRPAGSATTVNFNLVTMATSGSSTKVGPNLGILSYTNNLWPVATWVQGTVSFSAFPSQVYDGFWFEDQSGNSSVPYSIYFDDVVLISAPSTTTAAATTATTAKATTTTTGATTATTAKSTTTTTATTAKATTTTGAATTATTAKATTTTASATTATTAKATTATTGATTATTGATTATTAKSTTTTTTGSTTGSTINPALGDPTVQAFYTTPVTGGLATYYGPYVSGGTCMLDPTPTAGLNTSGITNTVAIMTNQFLNSKTCGMCLSVTGTPGPNDSGPTSSQPTGTRIVFVNNLCPSCLNGGLDFGLNGSGQWGITYVAVPCPVGSTLIQYVFKSGSSAYWIGLQPRNTRYPVFTFELMVSGAWTTLTRESYNDFEGSFSSGVTFPAQIRLTGITGEQLIDTIQSVQNGVIVQGAVQFQTVQTV